METSKQNLTGQILRTQTAHLYAKGRSIYLNLALQRMFESRHGFSANFGGFGHFLDNEDLNENSDGSNDARYWCEHTQETKISIG
jgi:hypothetical protein